MPTYTQHSNIQNFLKGKFAIIKDCVKIEDNTIIPSYTTIPSFSVVEGKPGVVVEELPETASELLDCMFFFSLLLCPLFPFLPHSCKYHFIPLLLFWFSIMRSICVWTTFYLVPCSFLFCSLHSFFSPPHTLLPVKRGAHNSFQDV